MFLLAPSNASPPLSAQSIEMLKTFPIFSAYHGAIGSASTSYVAIISSSYTVLTPPPTEIEEKVLTSNFLRYKSPADMKTLLSLGVSSMHRRSLYANVVFPRLSQFSLPLLNDTMAAFLVDLPSLCRDDANFKGLVMEARCVPSSDGTLNKPTDLFDPANQQFCVLLDENAFPSEFFRDPNLLLSLRLLGLQSTLTFEVVIECAKRIEKNAVDALTNEGMYLTIML